MGYPMGVYARLSVSRLRILLSGSWLLAHGPEALGLGTLGTFNVDLGARTDIHIHMQTHTHKYTHTHKLTHTDVQTDTDTYTHTYTCTSEAEKHRLAHT